MLLTLSLVHRLVGADVAELRIQLVTLFLSDRGYAIRLPNIHVVWPEVREERVDGDPVAEVLVLLLQQLILLQADMQRVRLTTHCGDLGFYLR